MRMDIALGSSCLMLGRRSSLSVIYFLRFGSVSPRPFRGFHRMFVTLAPEGNVRNRNRTFSICLLTSLPDKVAGVSGSSSVIW